MVVWEKIFVDSEEIRGTKYANLTPPGYGDPRGSIAFLGNGYFTKAFFQKQFQSKIHKTIGNDRALVWVWGPSPQDSSPCNFQLVKFSSTDKTLEDTSIPFAGYELKIPAGAAVKKVDDDSLEISWADGNSGAITFCPTGSGSSGEPAAADLTKSIWSSWKLFINKLLPFLFSKKPAGKGDKGKNNQNQLDQKVVVSLGKEGSAGNLTFSGTITGTVLDASVRYFFKEETENSPGEIPGLSGRLCYPVIEDYNQEFYSFKGSINPAQPFNHKKNHLLFTEAETYRTNFRTTLGQVIKLTVIPDRSGTAYAWDPVKEEAYTILKGEWQVGFLSDQGSGNGSDVDIDLMAGLSGVEFAKIANGSIMQFVPGGPAYAPGFPGGVTGGAASLTAQYPGSTQDVTTSWVYFRDKTEGPVGAAVPAAISNSAAGSSGPRGYYTQPEAAGLYTAIPGGPTGAASMLEAFNLRAAKFPPGATCVLGAPGAGFPMAPYGGVTVTPETCQCYKQFEHEVLTPTRSNAIYQMDGNADEGPSGLAISDLYFTGVIGASGPSGATGPSGPTVPAVTPQGLFSTFTPSPVSWQSLLLAKTGNGAQLLAYTEIKDKLQTALLTNQLFLVVTNPGKLQQYCSVMYKTTLDVLNRFENLSPHPPQEAIDAAGLFLDKTYFAYSFFQPEVKEQFGGNYDDWGEKFIQLAEFSQLIISGWKFDLPPHRWSDKQTILIIKFADKSVEGLIDNLSSWTMAGVFNDNPSVTQKTLKQIAADAKKAAKTEKEFDYFVNTVLADASTYGGSETWNGVLYLNCAVPPNSFPPQLRGLAVGIDESKFRAHHLGINISSINANDNTITVGDSSLFGLIDYQDTEDLVYNGNPYDFKVLTLRVLFANSEITSFASQIEILVAELFGELCSLQNSQHGNNIILNGIWQKHGNQDSYAFIGQDENVFAVNSHVLDTVIIDKAHFITIIPEGGFQPGADVSTEFLFWGQMRFKSLKGFDLFSFGPDDSAAGSAADGPGLVYSNLVVSMKFAPDDTGDNSKARFEFLAGQMVFDLSSSAARAGSLYQKFPLQVTAMIQSSSAANPPDMGYLVVDSPLPAGSLGTPWFGLKMDLSLGSPGGLAEKAGFTATLLAAWAPGKENANVAIGLKLPGSEGSSKSLRIEGPLKLDIGNIRFFYNQSEKAYLMKFQNIALSFLSLKFPPGGKTNILLFGDPDPKSSNSTLGWYAAYKKDEKKNNESESNSLIRLLQE